MADKVFNDVKLSVKWKKAVSYTGQTYDNPPEGWPTGYYTKSGNVYTPVASDATFSSSTVYYKVDPTVLPDIDDGKDAQGFVNQNLATTMGVIGQYLTDYKTFKTHGHALTDANITGTLPVGKGGTGATTFTYGNVLIGNGTNALTTKSIDTTVTDSSTNLVTSGAVYTAIEALGKVFNIKSVGQYASVSQLPTTGNKQGDVHLIRVDTAPDTDNDSFEEYVWVQESGSSTGQWEFFGRLNVAGVNDASTSTKGITYLKNAASDITGSTSSDVDSTPYAATPYAVKSFVYQNALCTDDTITINCIP